MSLRNKKILITAGPTWVSIDNTRVISNIASGQTGILLAEELRELGAIVTLILGPAEACCLNKNIRLLRFKFFEELKKLIVGELKAGKYDILIHSAAVSDYRPAVVSSRKIKSDKKKLKIDLFPTPKIIDLVKKIDKSVILVGFKFEPGAEKSALLKKAKALMSRSHSDLVVANTIRNNHYQAYIMDKQKACGPFSDKKDMIRKLIIACGERL
ncbi:MAG: phosphopantothenoylcysteine decarboxylase [Candidatus Omnitrophota bacterium]